MNAIVFNITVIPSVTPETKLDFSLFNLYLLKNVTELYAQIKLTNEAGLTFLYVDIKTKIINIIHIPIMPYFIDLKLINTVFFNSTTPNIIIIFINISIYFNIR